MRVRLADGAKRDFNDGLRWYRRRSDQAADRFISATSSLIDTVVKNPTLYRSARPGIRVIAYKRYPYRLFYQILTETILVIAIAHDKRRENYWKHRIA